MTSKHLPIWVVLLVGAQAILAAQSSAPLKSKETTRQNVVEAAINALGANAVKTLQFSGSGATVRQHAR
jgi:hypothetical protein